MGDSSVDWPGPRTLRPRASMSLWPLLKHFQVTFSGKKITFIFLLV